VSLYHINPITGDVGLCRAQHQCPLGARDEHYATALEAREIYELIAEVQHYRSMYTELELSTIETSQEGSRSGHDLQLRQLSQLHEHPHTVKQAHP
jgi:hypothetical protein